VSVTATEYQKQTVKAEREAAREKWVLDAVGPLTNDAWLFLLSHGKVWGDPDKVIARFDIKSARLLKNGKGRGEEVITWPAGPDGVMRVYQYRRRHKARRWLTLPSGKGARLFGDLDAAAYIIVEGEWDLFAAYDLGLDGVVCGTAGAGTWLPEWTERCHGKSAAVIYDIDEKGQGGARGVCDALYRTASEVRNVLLPLDPKIYPQGDLSDYIGFDGNMQRRHTLDNLLTLIRNTPPYDPAKAAYPVACKFFWRSNIHHNYIIII